MRATLRARKWLFSGIGAVVIALTTAWAMHGLGPTERDPYVPPDVDRIENDFSRRMVLVGHFISWVLEEGKPGRAYEREIMGVVYRFTARAKYTDGQGSTCRKLYGSKMANGEWKHDQPQTYIKVEGEWKMKR